jgi:excisionase family DNA binding protein
MDRNDFYTVSEAAEILDRTVQTIYRMMKSGRLQSSRNPVTGRYMILKADAVRIREWR